MVKVNQNIAMSSALGRRSISQKAPTINIRQYNSLRPVLGNKYDAYNQKNRNTGQMDSYTDAVHFPDDNEAFNPKRNHQQDMTLGK